MRFWRAFLNIDKENMAEFHIFMFMYKMSKMNQGWGSFKTIHRFKDDLLFFLKNLQLDLKACNWREIIWLLKLITNMILCCKKIHVFILKIIFSELFTCHSILILRICQILWLVWFSEKYYYTLKQFDIKSVKLVGDRPKEKKYETTFF